MKRLEKCIEEICLRNVLKNFLKKNVLKTSSNVFEKSLEEKYLKKRLEMSWNAFKAVFTVKLDARVPMERLTKGSLESVAMAPLELTSRPPSWN